MRESKPSPCGVFRMEYEIGDTGVSMWTAHIAAFSNQEAIGKLVRTVGKTIKVNVTGMQCRLDELTNAIRKEIIQQWHDKKDKPITANCYRVEYEMGENGSNWVCFIASFDHQSAINHLVQMIRKPIRVNVTGLQCRVDNISDEIRRNVVMRWQMSKPNPTEIAEVKEPIISGVKIEAEEENPGVGAIESELQETIADDNMKEQVKKAGRPASIVKK